MHELTNISYLIYKVSQNEHVRMSILMHIYKFENVSDRRVTYPCNSNVTYVYSSFAMCVYTPNARYSYSSNAIYRYCSNANYSYSYNAMYV